MPDSISKFEADTDRLILDRAVYAALDAVAKPDHPWHFVAFSELAAFMAISRAECDVHAIRNAALVVVELLGIGYTIGCEAFVAALRLQIRLACGPNADIIQRLMCEIERRYELLKALAAELLEFRSYSVGVEPYRERLS